MVSQSLSVLFEIQNTPLKAAASSSKVLLLAQNNWPSLLKGCESSYWYAQVAPSTTHIITLGVYYYC